MIQGAVSIAHNCTSHVGISHSILFILYNTTIITIYIIICIFDIFLNYFVALSHNALYHNGEDTKRLTKQTQKDEVRGRARNEPLDLRDKDIDDAHFEDIEEKDES